MSSLGKLNWQDMAHTAIVLFFGTLLSILGQVVVKIHFVDDPTLNASIITILSFGITYLSKKLGTNQDGKLLGKI